MTPGNLVLEWKLYLSFLVETKDLPSQFLHFRLIAKTTTHPCSAKVNMLVEEKYECSFFPLDFRYLSYLGA